MAASETHADAGALARDPETLAARLFELDPAAADRRDDVRVAFAPGRVNLIGEHTDYNEGFVLPVAIDLGIAIALVPTDDGVARLTLAENGETREFAAADPGPRQNAWIDYVAGMGWALAQAGLPVTGFRGL
ncbi:MAG TPA: galactokinase family protein, partial [Candidatus Limnocylindrales bacterium]